jgi:hypothetical protein
MGFLDKVGDYGSQALKSIFGSVPGVGEIIRQEDMDKYAREAGGYVDQYGAIGEEAAAAIEALQNGLSPEELTPSQFSALQQMNPEVAQYVAEAAPHLMDKAGQGRDLMTEQADAARAMSVSGDTPAMRAQRELANMDASALQSNLLNQIKTQGRQEGRGGGGTDLMLALGAGKQAQEAMYKASLQNQANSDNTRMQALQMMGTAGQNIQANDQQSQAANVSTMNQYNQRLAQNKWDYEKNKADTMNQAQTFNINQNQGIANKNVEAANKAKEFNIKQRQDMQNNKTKIQQDAINARLQGKEKMIAGKAGIAGNVAGFNEGAGTRTSNDLANTSEVIKVIGNIVSKKGAK